MLRLIPILLAVVFWVYCIVEVLMAPEDQVRRLRKPWWVMVVLFLPVLGGLIWLLAGRPRANQARPGPGAAGFPEYDRPGRATSGDPVKDAEFLRQVRRRAEEQRRRSREQEEQRRARRDSDGVAGAPDSPDAPDASSGDGGGGGGD